MIIEARTIAYRIKADLEILLNEIKNDTTDVLATNHIPTIVTYFNHLRDEIDEVKTALKPVAAHVEGLSREDIPTIFFNQSTKTITVDDVGRVSVNQRWSATPINKPAAFAWLRNHNNGGLIQETVHHETLGAVAREAAMAGDPLPDTLFRVSTSNHLSITKV